MGVPFRCALGLGVLVLAACAARRAEVPVDAAAAGSAPPPYTLERFREEHKLPGDAQRIVLDNPYGDIQLRQTSASAVAFEGVEQRIGEAPRIARVDWSAGNGEAAVRVRYPGIDPELPADRRRGRVDLYVFVPPGVPVSLRTDFGEIVVRRIDNDVQARSREGRITVAAHGRLDIESDRGELRIYPMSARGLGLNRLRSDGGIVLDVHLQRPLDLTASGRHGVRADFDLDDLIQMSDGGTLARLRLEGGQGDQTRRFEIDSRAGEVLLQGIRAGTAQ